MSTVTSLGVGILDNNRYPSLTFSTSVSTNDVIIVLCSARTASQAPLVTTGGSWTEILSAYNATSEFGISVNALVSPAGAETSVAWDTANTGSDCGFCALKVNGYTNPVITVTPVENTTYLNADTLSIATGNITPTADGTFIAALGVLVADYFADGFAVDNSFVDTVHELTNYGLRGGSALATKDFTGTTPQGATFSSTEIEGGPGTKAYAGIFIIQESASAATLSAATPSGTLGTQTTATLGATTNVTSGTFYGVVDSAANISGITAPQIKAGNNNGDTAAVAANNSAVSDTSPSTGVTGLTANTLYSYAVAQNSAGGDSNVLTGTFTTAAVTRSLDSVTGSMYPGATGVTANCTGLDASPTTQIITIGGESCTITNWNSGNPIYTVPADIALKLGLSTYQLAVTDDTGTVTLDNQTLSAAPGRTIVNYGGTPPAANEEGLYKASVEDATINTTPGTDDQWDVETVADVTYDAYGTVTVSPAATKSNIAYRLWDNSLGGWVGPSTVTWAEQAALSSPGLVSTGQTTMTGTVTTDVNTGTLYMSWYTIDTPQAAADIAAGTGAAFTDSVAVSTIGQKTFYATGLNPTATYYAQSVHLNSGVYSNVAVSNGVRVGSTEKNGIRNIHFSITNDIIIPLIY